MKKLVKLSAIFALISLFISCSTVKMPDCVDKSSKAQLIRWGEISSTSDLITFYELRTDKSISLAVQQNKNSLPKYSKVGEISDSTYCYLAREAKKNILKVQALNSPGPKSNYFEMTDPGSNMYFHAVWNPQYENKGNHEFKILFEKLQQAVIEAGK